MDSLTCQQCGADFTLSPAVVERYPGWQPAKCRDCHGSGGSAGNSAKSASGKSGGSSPRRRSATATRLMTTAEVLDKYHGGPQSGVFTDGSSVPNPGPGGWGAVYVVDGEIVAENHGHDADTTNNRMELQALLAGANLVPDGTEATVYSDSNLAVRTVNEWAEGWERRGWKRKSGPVENLDLVKKVYYAYRRRPELTLQWIRAHDGSRWNEYADALATAWLRDEV